jgi:hypothetical protein
MQFRNVAKAWGNTTTYVDEHTYQNKISVFRLKNRFLK